MESGNLEIVQEGVFYGVYRETKHSRCGPTLVGRGESVNSQSSISAGSVDASELTTEVVNDRYGRFRRHVGVRFTPLSSSTKCL